MDRHVLELLHCAAYLRAHTAPHIGACAMSRLTDKPLRHVVCPSVLGLEKPLISHAYIQCGREVCVQGVGQGTTGQLTGGRAIALNDITITTRKLPHEVVCA